MQPTEPRPDDASNRFTPAERAQLRQLLIYLAAIVTFIILASLAVGLFLNLSN